MLRKELAEEIAFYNLLDKCVLNQNQDGRVVKALDLRSNGHMSAWVRTPLLVKPILNKDFCKQID